MGQIDVAEFLKRGLCVLVATRDAALRPLCVSGSAVVITARGRGIVFIPSFESTPAQANLRANGVIAVLVEEPTTHRGIQMKGRCLAVRDATVPELKQAAEFVARTKAELSAIGFAPTVLERMNFMPCTAVEFTVEQVFEQTPGPGAGRAVERTGMKLSEIMHCFQGVTPAGIATCGADGTPNMAMLSQVYYLDEKHVALSCQFFNKTRRNVDQNPFASVRLWDPVTLQPYLMQLRFLRAETSGPLFDDMAARIDAIARATGMAGIFRLISADVYEVLSLQTLSGALQAAPDTPLPWSPESGQAGREELRSLQLLSDRLCRARTLEALYAELLASMASLFGASHALLMLHEEDCGKLIAIDSRGYDRVGAGAEVKLGEGLIGTVARTRKPLRVGGLAAVRRYARAVRESASRAGARLEVEIPLPGLADAQAQLALPLVAHDRLIGVLALESRDPLAFEDWHEAFLSLLANQAALAIAILSDREDEDGEARVEPLPAPLPARRRLFTWFAGDESVFVDGEYLIRNVPARILWKLLREHAQGRREFSNRELRMDDSLGLPPVKDNLESRLILLRKRLAERCPDVRLVSVKRGRFVLERDCEIVLEEKP